MRGVALFAGSNASIFEIGYWTGIFPKTKSRELWVDWHSNWYINNNLQQYLTKVPVRQVFFYDWFHTDPGESPKKIELVKELATVYRCTFFSLNKTFAERIDYQHFDFCWNRSKRAFLEHMPGWNQGFPCNYTQWPVHAKPRPLALMTLNRRNDFLKQRLYDELSSIPGFHSHHALGHILETDYPTDYYAAVPPKRYYFDNSYISCQVESRFIGQHIVFTEKTYDFLLQGRIVLNFGPQNFYKTLESNGWKLCKHIDYSWDSIPDDCIEDRDSGFAYLPVRTRFYAFVDTVKRLCANLDTLHEIFLDNLDVFKHNQNMLADLPYSKINFGDTEA